MTRDELREAAEKATKGPWPPLVQLGRTIAMLSSVIKSGESWSEACQVEYDRANLALQEIYHAPDPAQIAAAERRGIERAAEVAERHFKATAEMAEAGYYSSASSAVLNCGRGIATAIRALPYEVK